MKIVTVRVPLEMHEEMKNFQNINWSEEIRRTIEQKLKQEKMKKACDIQDQLREKARGKWSGAKEIKKWRERRK